MAEEEHLVLLSDVKFKTAKCSNIWDDRRRDSSRRALRRLLDELTRLDTFSNVSQIRLVFLYDRLIGKVKFINQQIGLANADI